MKYGKFLVFVFVVAVGGLLVGVSASAASDFNVYQNANYKVVGHYYESMPTGYSSTNNGIVDDPYKFIYEFNIPVSIDVHVRGLSSLAADQTFSGYICFPIITHFAVNSTLVGIVNNDTSYGQEEILAETFSMTSTNGNGISYNYYWSGGVPWVALSFDSVSVTSMDRSSDNSYFVSVNFDYSSGWSFSGEEDNIYRDNLFSGIGNTFSLEFSSNIASTWVSGLTHNMSLTSMVTQAINNASDLDTIISILRSCSSSLTTWNQNFDAGYFASEIESAVVDAIDSSSDINSIVSAFSVLNGYASILEDICTNVSTRNLKYAINQATSIQSIVSLLTTMEANSDALPDILDGLDPVNLASAIDSSSDVDSIVSLLSSIGSNSSLLSSVLQHLIDLNYTMSVIYTDFEAYLSNISSTQSSWDGSISRISDIHLLLNRLAYAFSGGVGVSDREAYLSAVTNNWINIIKEALSDFEITVNIDNDEIVNIEVTNNDVTNIYNDQQIIQNFETNIELNFGEAFQDIDWNILNNGSDIVTVDFIQTNYIGGSLIQRMYNALGPYNVLVTITLFIGLVSALIGPINAFIGSKIH